MIVNVNEDNVDLIILIRSGDEKYNNSIDKLIQSLSMNKNLIVNILSIQPSIISLSISIAIDNIVSDDSIIDNIKNVLIKLDVRSLQLESCLSEYNKQYSNNYNKIKPFEFIYTGYNDLIKHHHHPILSNESYRIQIIMNMLMNETHFHDIQRYGIVIDVFPPHRHDSTLTIPMNILKLKVKELHFIKDYFSQYFACKISILLSVIRWLLVPSIITFIITIVIILNINLSFIASIGLPIYSIFMIKFIKRNFNAVLLEFGLLEKMNNMRLQSRAEPIIIDNDDVNSNFKGILKLSEIDNLTSIIYYSPTNKKMLRITLSYLFTFLLIICCKLLIFIIFFLGLVILKTTGSHHQSISFIIILNSIQTLLIPNRLISKTCYYLTDIENVRTNLEFNISMTTKLYIIDIVNTISPSLLLCLLQQQLCFKNTAHCTAGLSWNLFSTILIRSFMSLMNVFVNLKTKTSYQHNYSKLHDQLVSHPNFAKSSHMLINNVTNVGFVLMFTGSNPIILPIFTFFFIIEISIIMYNSIHNWRRICSTNDEIKKVYTLDIYVIEFLFQLIMISLIVSSGIYFFTSQLINFLNLQLRTILFIIYIVFVYLINLLLNVFIADIPMEYSLHIKRCNKILETILHHQSISIPLTSDTSHIEEVKKINSNSILPKVKTYHISSITNVDVRKTVSSYIEMYGNLNLIDDQKEISVYDDQKEI